MKTIAILFVSIISLQFGYGQAEGFDVQGHRGARGYYPENGITGMLFALEHGATTLEMDVVITGDMKVVLSHEPFMNHEICRAPKGADFTAQKGKAYNIYMMTYSKVKQFDCGSKGNPHFSRQIKEVNFKPLLTDVISAIYTFCDSLQKPLPHLNIEIKSRPDRDDVYHPQPNIYAKLLTDVLKEAKYPSEKVIIQSFDVRPLQILHEEQAPYRLALLVEGVHPKLKKQLRELGFTPDIYSPYYEMVTTEMISFMHDKEVKVIPWTVNTADEAVRLKDMGVDGVITDYPTIILGAIKTY